MNKTGFWIAVVSVVVLAGCASPAPKEPPPVEDRSTGDTRGVDDKAAADAQALAAGQADLLSKTRVHFAFDSSAIDSEARAIIEAHAAHLVANPGIRLVLEGHCDERGTREYNLALGERRAQAVERLMGALGVGADRITTVSFGEEKPIRLEHNESAWRLNRRVEIQHK